MSRYYEILIKDKENVPIHFFRYEDLVMEPEKTLSDIFCFILGVESIEETLI